jgi:hypothetical protein
MRKFKLSLLVLTMFASAKVLAASGDEIQVYNEEINKPGEFGVEVHANYVSSGVKTPAYIGEIPSHHNFRLTPEFNYGFTNNVDGGIYIPTIRDANGNWFIEGAKLRLKYIGDNRESGYYWGINGELGAVSKRTEAERWNLEIRPIFGYKTASWHFTINPILGFALSGNSHTPGFTPALKISRKATEKTWFSIEHYADYGEVNHLGNQGQATYLASDTEIFGVGLNVGVGRGWSGASDTTLKAIFAVPL